MKAMIEGVWRTDVEPTPAYRAAAERARFRAWVRADGASDLAPEPGRYHLYVSYA
jgi:putative glutathione S-transferase